MQPGEPVVLAPATRTSVQVATGRDPETGEVVVLIRFGAYIAALTPAGAAELGDALVVEAALATALGRGPVS